MAETIALLGAGGTMGCRIADNLRGDAAYDLRYVEPSPDGIDRLAERGLSTTPRDEAVADADAVILAVPDQVIGDVCEEIVPNLDGGDLVMALDPAAAYAGTLPEAGGVAYFVVHPCHPPLFEDRERAHEDDFFGGQGRASQPIACALHAGPEDAYARGEAIARDVFAPVSRVHRVSVEEMAILEPALAENLLTTCLLAVREGLDEVVAMGVSEDAARDFLLGHVRTQLAMFLGPLDHDLSDGAKLAVEQGRRQVLREDWKAVVSLDSVREHVREIAELE